MVTAKHKKINVSKASPQKGDRYWALREWISGPLGNIFSEQEHFEIKNILPKLFGYYLLALGEPQSVSQAVQHSLIQNKFHIYSIPLPQSSESVIVANEEQLPIVTDGVDVVYLAHCLEFSSHPHEILREASRILIAEGHMIITGFNPFSLWGLWQSVLKFTRRTPWNGSFISIFRIKDWLSLLGFETIRTQTFFFRPPMSNQKIMRRLYWLEWCGRKFWPLLGGAYIIVAQKKLIPLTPIRQRWRIPHRLVGEPLIEPSRRSG